MRKVLYGVALGSAITSSLLIPKTKTTQVTMIDANGLTHSVTEEDTCVQEPVIAAKAAVFEAPKKTVKSTRKLVDYGFTSKELMGLHTIEDRHQRRLAYIQRFYSIAMIEQQRYGIPASITLAQGILESNAGASDLAVATNNHFGIKCHLKSHQGGKAPHHCKNQHDDDAKDVFVIYKSPWESFRAHSKVLKKQRYRKCYKNDPMNYYGWADDLKDCGYATDPEYNINVASLVELYDLNQFTEAAMQLTSK